jgi:hypothetical protein
MHELAEPSSRGRLGVVVAVLLLGCVLFRFTELPEQILRLEPLGSPLEIRITGTWALVITTVLVACSGTNYVLEGRRRLPMDARRPAFLSWILPGAVAGASAYLLDIAPNQAVWVAGLITLGTVFGLSVSAEYTALSPDAPGHLRARLALNVLAYVLAFVLFTTAYGARARSLVTATVALLVGCLLAIDLLSVATVGLRRVLPYAAVVGLIVGEGMWALNYWRLGAATGGLVLLLLFYGGVTIAQQHLFGRLRPAVLGEMVAVAVVVLAIALVWGP